MKSNDPQDKNLFYFKYIFPQYTHLICPLQGQVLIHLYFPMTIFFSAFHNGLCLPGAPTALIVYSIISKPMSVSLN